METPALLSCSPQALGTYLKKGLTLGTSTLVCQGGHSSVPRPTVTAVRGLEGYSSETRMVPGKVGCSAASRGHLGGLREDSSAAPESYAPERVPPWAHSSPVRGKGRSCLLHWNIPPTTLVLQMPAICPVRERNVGKSSEGHSLVASRPETRSPSVRCG